MIFRFLRVHASAAITTASVVVVAALVLVVALVSSGYTEQKLELNDASVWVTNGSRHVIGRANTDVLELNTVVKSDGGDIDVLQRGDTVLTHDHTSNTVQLVDAASSTVLATVPLPPGDPEVFLIDDYVVIHSAATGEVWLVRQGNLDSFDEAVEPDLTLEENSVVAVDDEGLLVGYDRQSNRLVTTDIRTGADPRSITLDGFDADDADDLQLTTVGGTAALLNVTTGVLRLGGDRAVDFSDRLGDAEEVSLESANATDSSVVIAHDNGLLEVDAATGSVSELVDDATGRPAKPVSDAGCTYAAWSGGLTWQRCGDEQPIRAQLADARASEELAFRSNGDDVVLNERAAGRVWAVQNSNRLIDNWDQLIDDDEDKKNEELQQDDTPPVLEKEQQPPVAVADSFGARPGRANELPVLLNDYDPNGDVLVIGTVGDIPPEQGRLEFITDAQKLQLTLSSGASGVISFDYTVTDGRGGSATATVTVTVRAPGENSPPVQARVTKASVAAGGAAKIDVLGDWYDPDGDPMYLEQAQINEPDRASFSPNGEIDYQDKGSEAAEKQIGLQVSDFSEAGSGTVDITVGNPGTVPIIAEGFVVSGYTGEELTISPLPNVRGGTGTLRLSTVAEFPNTVIVPNYAKGSFTFTSAQAGTFYLSYSVTDAAQQTGTGVVRVDVTVPPDASTKPITVPTVAFLYQQQTDLVDVLASDIDPAGGVLSISAVTGVQQSSGAVVEILEHRILRVRLNNLLPEPLEFGYTVTNGLSSAEGRVTVFQIPEPKRLQAPVANLDTVSVRVGEVIDVPVIANDEHPNRKPLVLAPELVQTVPDGGGLLFVAGNKLRYLAPDEPGDFTAVYRLNTTADVQFDTAEVKITVREADVETNTPPVPPVLSSRVVAGQTVKIPVPLGAMDADGDAVRLVGASSNPEKGSVTVGTSSFTYTAGNASQGTDVFAYEVVDSLGARAQGAVRVGISQGLDTASSPVALDDVVVTTPGKAVTVRVLANDSDPNASALEVVGVEPSDSEVKTSFTEDRVTFDAPKTEGDYGAIYTIQNAEGQQASAWLRVRVDKNAPPVRPEAEDTVLSLTDILDRDTVIVDVLRNVFFAEGDVADLTVSIVKGYDSTSRVQASGRVNVEVTRKSQIIPFTVARSDDPSVSATAFIWVPGLDDALPELRRNAKPLEVLSGDTLTIDINDYVVAAGGKKVRLTDEATVKASNSNSANLVVSPNTLQFTSRDGYWGPASVSFEVTDGADASDPAGKKAVIVLAIKVNPRDNQPPTFTGAEVSLQPGDERVLELKDLTKYPYPDDLAQLVYAINSQPSGGFTAALDGTTLTVSSAEDNKVGTVSEFSVGVRDAKSEGKAGVVRLRAVTSNRPLVSPGADALTIKRGESQSTQVLANDVGTNPFPGKPLAVVAVQGAAPAGVLVVPSSDKSTLTVSVDKNVDLKTAGQVTLQYQVADATKDPGRYTWGTVTITIVDAPDQPVAPTLGAGGFQNGQLTVTAAPLPYPNGSPITSFLIRSDDNGGYAKDCGASATCVLTDLPAGQNYTFYSVAVNQYGESLPSGRSAPMRSDYIPAPPQNVTVAREPANGGQSNEGAVIVSWGHIPDPSPGSAVRGIQVQIGGTTIPADRNQTSVRFQGAPGTEYSAVVWAENGADTLYPGQIPWNKTTSNSVVAAGRPTGGGVNASVAGNDGSIRVDWSGFNPNGGSGPSYTLARYPAGANVPQCSTGNAPGNPAGSGAVVNSSADDIGNRFVFAVYADNGWGCTTIVSEPVRALRPPPPPAVSLMYADPVEGRYGVVVDRAEPVVMPNTSPGEYHIEQAGVGPVSRGSAVSNPENATFVSCIVSDGATLCSSPVAASNPIAPVDANATVTTCTPGSTATAVMNNPGGLSWKFEFSFRGKLRGNPSLVWSPWSTDAKVPAVSGLADSYDVAVRTTATADGQTFTNGGLFSAEDLFKRGGRSCP